MARINNTLAINICGESFATRSPFTLHLKMHELKSSCLKTSGSCVVDVITADKWRALIKNKTKTCPICNKSYPGARNMRKHLRLVHDKNSTTTCTMCKKTFRNKATFQKHMQRAHVGLKISVSKHFECNYCHAKFSNKSLLSDHISSHTGLKNYKCHVCDKAYSCRKALKTHTLLHEQEKVIKSSKKEFIIDTGDCTLDEWNDFIKRRVTVCPKCNRDYRNPRNMRKHLRRVHTSVRKYGCDECGKMLKSRDSLNTHKKIQHEGKKVKVKYEYECDYCGAKYPNKYTLSDHISGHTGIPNHICKICNKGYACAASLKIHNIKTHLQFTGVPIEKFKCDLCDKEFFEKKKLNKHKNWAHGDKFHLCKVCGAKIKGSLKQHMITHTGERKYCCHICGKKLRGKLKEHMLNT
ncbi:zinc finger protein 808-like [Diaphorina citri]|uniref:Zinc finger protein 808-like n=1 Tax=Diaphorina citri TaxID=121845 RepID=A0A1S3DUY2_DIACI|nr:zinc finger protein 808-like [Diaphorina citri]